MKGNTKKKRKRKEYKETSVKRNKKKKQIKKTYCCGVEELPTPLPLPLLPSPPPLCGAKSNSIPELPFKLLLPSLMLIE